MYPKHVDWFYKEFGTLVKKARKDAKLSQEQLADRVGVARTSITNIEVGRQHTPLHMVARIAGILGVDPAALIPAFSPDKEQHALSDKIMKKIPDGQKEKEWVIRHILTSAGESAKIDPSTEVKK